MQNAGGWVRNQPNTILFVLVDVTNNEVLGLGSTFDLQISKGGAAFAASAGTKSEAGLGWYKYVTTAGEADTPGPVAIAISHESISQQNLEYVVDDRVTSAVEFTYTITRSDNSAPIQGVEVSFATSNNVATTVWRGVTDSFGVARDAYDNLPRLAPGTYTVFSYKVGYSFPVDTEVVS